MNKTRQRYDTVVIGGGQAGLATGYYLQQQGRNFIILDAAEHTGDSWRNRWDSLRLFTPARYAGLPGLPFPGDPYGFPTKDEFADYLQSYAEHFALPVRPGVWVKRLAQEGERFVVVGGEQYFEASNVVVAMSNYQVPRVPPFAGELDPGITQMHSSEYRNPSQLQEGPVLIVGAGNSGAEIGIEVVREHPTWLAGRDVGHVPFRIETAVGKRFLVPLVLNFLYHQILFLKTPIGRRARPKMLHKAAPLVRVKPGDLLTAGMKRVPRMVGVAGGLPVIGENRRLDVANVIWCTGFRSEFSWIDLPVFTDGNYPDDPQHERGIVPHLPGLYFVGLSFLYAMSSSLINGVSRDAQYVTNQLASRPVWRPGHSREDAWRRRPATRKIASPIHNAQEAGRGHPPAG